MYETVGSVSSRESTNVLVTYEGSDEQLPEG